ncbi:hypothetical protein N7452_009865 [Penicillium brevicompactum]|uniref:Uncharacterized protein n=1 Tax=Penicillium brevicompactum TaxID=5074 RepID=A0A9W9Q9G3_PENBR|nr:hypothetical protein N7452_009865 [Penicillium brevicompactum]
MSRSLSTHVPVGNKDFTNATVVIIGAGISGICMAIDLIKRNNCHNFVILERSSSVGGTWNDNKYPGSCCDVWSTLYSYSFEQNPNWTREYPGQEEIHKYLVGIAEKWGLYKHIRFNSTVEEAHWDDEEAKWRIKLSLSGQKDSEFSSAYVINSDFLVSAVGQLNLPRYPNIPGLDDFQGKMMHSARWDWTYDPSGKRIAIIGNGATAAQIVPEIAQVASHLTVYQRTPNWVIPRNDGPVSSFQKTLFNWLPPLLWRKRAAQMDFRESFYEAVADKDSDFAQWIRSVTASALKAHLPNNPELRDTLTPKYAPGCKRVIITDDYYPALARENVNLETREITSITEAGIEVDGEDEQEYDLIVLATGFKTVEFMHPIKIFGSNGRSLEDIWRNGARAYNGVSVEDLPNFGMFYGPNTNLGHNSIILMIEAQSRYLNALVGEVIKARQRGKTLALKPGPDALQAFNDRIQSTLQSTSFADPNCASWYKRDDGLITNNWCGTAVDYQIELSKVRWPDYIAEGTDEKRMVAEADTNIGRVHEGSILSDKSVLMGAISVLSAAGYLVARSKLFKAH